MMFFLILFVILGGVFLAFVGKQTQNQSIAGQLTSLFGWGLIVLGGIFAIMTI